MAKACAAFHSALVATAAPHELDLLMDAPSRFPGFEGANAAIRVLPPFKFGNRLLTQAFGGDPWYRARVPLAKSVARRRCVPAERPRTRTVFQVRASPRRYGSTTWHSCGRVPEAFYDAANPGLS